MKQNAFTMIELIFVIVILGILSAVAIPKLMATKDDAYIVKEVANAKQVMQNANSEYISQGSFSSYPSTKCYSFTGASDGNFTVAKINLSTDLCTQLFASSLSNGIDGSYQFGGTKVQW